LPQGWGPPPLTARPEGLLSSLGIQSGGKYPQHLAGDLLPTYELGPWYREYNGTFRSGTVDWQGTQAGEEAVLFEVPDGEVWILNRFSAWWDKAVNNQMGCTFYRQNNAGGTRLVLGQAELANNAAARLWVYANPGNLPIILRPTVQVGGRIDWLTGGISGTNIPISWQISVTICKI
jgi:hypothetical protein